MNKLLLHTTTWMNLTNTRLSKTSQTSKNTYWMIPFMQDWNTGKMVCVLQVSLPWVPWLHSLWYLSRWSSTYRWEAMRELCPSKGILSLTSLWDLIPDDMRKQNDCISFMFKFSTDIKPLYCLKLGWLPHHTLLYIQVHTKDLDNIYMCATLFFLKGV